MKTPIQVALVDDHAIVREGLRAFLSFAEDIQIVAEATSAPEAVRLVMNTPLDVILMDLVMPGSFDGIEGIRQIVANQPTVKVIALTSFQDPERTRAALEAGALSYLQKDVAPDDLLTAIRQAYLGRSLLDKAAVAAIRRTALDAPPGKPSMPTTKQVEGTHTSPQPTASPFTDREKEVLAGLAKGMSNKELASALRITEKTVKVHVSHIIAKLDVYDRTQAILAAAKLGYIRID